MSVWRTKSIEQSMQDTDDPEQLKAWVRGVIGALPTRRDGGTHDGDS